MQSYWTIKSKTQWIAGLTGQMCWRREIGF